MPIAAMVDNPAVNAEVYDRIRQHLGIEGPAGGYVHVAGPGPNGWRVIELWDSEDDARRFYAERLGPAFAAAGVEGGPPQPQFWPVHNFMTAATREPAARV